MTEKLLKAKHWQIFLPTFGIPILIQIFMMGYLISNFISKPDIDPETLFTYMKFLPLISMFFMAILFCWIWSVAVGLQNKVPENIRMKVNKFKVFFFISLIYIFLFMSIFAFLPDFHMETHINSNIAVYIALFFLFFLLQLFSIFCMLYTLYFVAKTYKTVELQRQTTFLDFAGEFFLIWFFPIGIWIIQPKINKIIED